MNINLNFDYDITEYINISNILSKYNNAIINECKIQNKNSGRRGHRLFLDRAPSAELITELQNRYNNFFGGVFTGHYIQAPEIKIYSIIFYYDE